MARWTDYREPGDREPGPLPDRDEPEPDVQVALAVLFGAQLGWSRDREHQHYGRCSVCGNGLPATPIQPGSRLCCMGCLRYGLDDQVRGLLAITPAKPRTRPCTVAPARKGKGGRGRTHR